MTTKFEAFLNKHKLTTCGLAKRVGLSKSQVSEYRRDLHRPSKRTAMRIAVALHLPIEDVLSQIDIKERQENHPRPKVFCATCGRLLYKLPNPVQVETVLTVENTPVAA